MAISCGYCGTSMPDISHFCPACGRSVLEGTFFPPEPQPVTAGDQAMSEGMPKETVMEKTPVEWNERLVGACAYLTFIPAVVFLSLKQYRERTFIRFHAFQSVFFWAAVAVLLLAGYIASTFGWLFLWLLAGALVLLGLFFIWLVLCVKALQGEWFELPFLGALAGQQAER